MPEAFLPFSRPSISEEDVAAVSDVLRSGWITTGAKAAEFERRFCRAVGSPGAVALTSATAALHVALGALDVGPGDEVVTPSMTWASTPNLVVLSGAKPVFVDVDRDTLMVDAARVEAALSERTRLIVPVHFAGAPLELEPLRALAERRGIALIEDAAHALGTRYRGETVGARGTAMFSFHPIKNVTTGEGGMLTSDDASLLERARRLKFHGLGVDAFERETQGRAPQAEVLEPGWKYNLTDMSAALGLSQLARLDEFNGKRRALAERYLELLAEVEEVRPLALPEDPASHAWHLFVVRVDSPRVGRDAFMAALKERGIGTGLHFRAVHLQRWYREELGMRPGSLPDTEWNSDRICSLPLFPDMRPEDVERVVREIRAVLSTPSP